MISGSSMFTFDAYNQVEIQPIYLANPDGTILYNLGTIYDRNFELRFNTMSTFSFTAPSSADGIATDYYNWLQYRRLVYVDNIGTFMITEISRENDGMMETKKVVCKSLEVMLSYKKLTLFTGTYKFYSSTAPEGTLMEEVMSYIPGWTIAYVSEELDDYDNTAGIYRTFDVTDKTIYDFLMNEVSQTFQCVFVFDSIEKTISIYTIEEATQPSDIFISFENLMESFSISESTGELVTALTVYGGDSKEGELGINLVNPLGTNTIYNFSYFKNTSWMDADLVTAITNWEALVEANRTSYSNYLTAYKEKNREILFYKSTSLTLSAEMAALNLEKDVLLEGGFSLDSILAEISDKQDEIDANYNALTTATQEANTILESLRAINTAVSFETNFTSEQIEKLDNFIIGNTYTNTNFLITDIMSDVEVQEMATELYTEGVNVLSKVAQPRYTFELNMANFLFIKEFEPFIAQLAFGEEITVEISAGSFLYPVLLGIDFNYDDPNQFKMLLSNRLRMGDEEFQYNDLFGSIVDSSTTSEFNSKKWNDISGFFGGIASGSSNVIINSNAVTPGNLAVFTHISGSIITDVGAMYVEPTYYTPAYYCSDTSFTYGDRWGYYSIIGRTLFYNIYLVTTGSSGAGSGNLAVLLPTYSKDIVGSPSSVIGQNFKLNTAGGFTTITGMVAQNTKYLYLYEQWEPGGNLANLTGADTHLSAGTTYLYASGFYFID